MTKADTAAQQKMQTTTNQKIASARFIRTPEKVKPQTERPGLRYRFSLRAVPIAVAYHLSLGNRSPERVGGTGTAAGLRNAFTSPPLTRPNKSAAAISAA
jgi:hypothetical protein